VAAREPLKGGGAEGGGVGVGVHLCLPVGVGGGISTNSRNQKRGNTFRKKGELAGERVTRPVKFGGHQRGSRLPYLEGKRRTG